MRVNISPRGVAWRVELSKDASRKLDSIHEPDHSRLRRRILALMTHTRPPGAIPVKGTVYLRLRVGDWRVLYELDPEVQLVRVAYVLRRNEGTYSQLL